MKHLRIGVLASGGGSNLQSIIDRSLDSSLNGEVVLVVSNNSKAKALERARNHGINGLHISSFTEGSQEEADKRICDEMLAHDVDLIVLAGYMKSIGSELIDTFEGRIINIHPALLPKFGGKGMYGMNVHRAVVAAGETESGPTVHYVDGKYDHGEIISQRKIPVYPDDTPEELQKRVLVEEHKIFPEVIQKLSEEWER
ncbi:phosphoribosylglycinamide formyltransferase [Candidatus Latescibacterota bacterium]